MTDIELRLLISGDRVRLLTDEAAGRVTEEEIRLDSFARKQIAVYERQLSLGTLTDREELEVLGEQLYRILFNGSIGAEFERVTSRSGEIKGRVHLVLEFDEEASELSRLPWEYLYRPSSGYDRGTFFISRPDIALARRLVGPKPVLYPPAEPPLRVLRIAVNPPESTEVTDHRIASMRKLQDNQALALRTLEEADFSAVLDEIRSWSPHVVHYMGGATPEGKLAFGNPDKGLQWVDIDNLADLQGLADVRVIILELIEAGRYEAPSQGVPGSNDFRQIPVRLARALPATVVANQFPMTSDARRAFFDRFYDAAVGGIPVMDAVQRGRLALRDTSDGSSTASFGTPVVYLQGVSDAALLRFPEPELVRTDVAATITQQSSRPNPQAQAPSAPEPQLAVTDEAQVQAPSAPEPQLAVTDEAAGVVADRLPADGDALVGRKAELKRLLSILRRAGTRGRSRPPVVVVTGESGIGKTFLAVHGSRRLRERFPHGTLFVALGGPTRPGILMALRDALEDLEPEPRYETELRVSAEPFEELVARYRRAFSDRQILVVVDDALEASDIEPFIPPNPSSALVVTSTSQFSLPNAQFLNLSPLKDDEVAGHLEQVLQTRGIQLPDELVLRVMAVTGGYPQAVSLAGAILREAPPTRVALSLEAVQRAMADASSLAASEVPEDVFERYKALASETQRLFRLLGLVPTPDFEAGFAAALLDTDESIARERLDRLIDADLVGRSKNGRYSLPASARAAARYQCPQRSRHLSNGSPPSGQ